MVVTVILSGIPRNIELTDLASYLDNFLNSHEVGTFRLRNLPPESLKRLVAIDFNSGFDAMSAQEQLHGYQYVLEDGRNYTLQAKVKESTPSRLRTPSPTSSDAFYKSLVPKFTSKRDEYTANYELDAQLSYITKQTKIMDTARKYVRAKRRLRHECQQYIDKVPLNEYERSRSRSRSHHCRSTSRSRCRRSRSRSRRRHSRSRSRRCHSRSRSRRRRSRSRSRRRRSRERHRQSPTNSGIAEDCRRERSRSTSRRWKSRRGTHTRSRSRDHSDRFNTAPEVTEIVSVDRCPKNQKNIPDTEELSTSKINKNITNNETEEDMRLKMKEAKQEIELEMETALRNNFQIKEYDRSLVITGIRKLLHQRFQKISSDISRDKVTINQVVNYYRSKYSKQEDKIAVKTILRNAIIDYVVPSEQTRFATHRNGSDEQLELEKRTVIEAKVEFESKLLEAKTQILLDIEFAILRKSNNTLSNMTVQAVLKIFSEYLIEQLEAIISTNPSSTIDDIVQKYKQIHTFKETKDMVEKIIQDNQPSVIELDSNSAEDPRLTWRPVDDDSDKFWADVGELLMDIQRDSAIV